MATEKQSLALKIFGIVTGTLTLGVFAYVQFKPVLNGVDAEHPGPIIAAAVVVIALVGLSIWRLVVRKRELGSRIRRPRD